MTKVVAGCFETGSEGRRHLECVENIRVVSLDVRSEASVRAAVEAVTRLAGSEGLTALELAQEMGWTQVVEGIEKHMEV